MAYFTYLTLEHFRNHHHTHLQVDDASFIILHGANGAGKTNILEALSLFSPGKGFRQAGVEQQHQSEVDFPYWIVRAGLINSQLSTLSLVTAHQRKDKKRIIKVEGESLPRQVDILDQVQLLWFLPSMSHLFQEGMSERRRYFDRVTYGLDKEHASRVYAYEHYMRERKKVLAMPYADPVWLASLEKKMAEYSVAIACARLDMAERMNKACQQLEHSLFPRASLFIIGDAETLLLDGHAALDVEQAVCEKLEHSRMSDRQSRRCQFGAHKTKFEVSLLPQGKTAEYCSTGEQKALLISLLLAQIILQADWLGHKAIILLDEMVAHLDKIRRDALFELLAAKSGQVWATGTDIADFAAAPRYSSRFFHVKNGQVEAA